MTTTLDDFFGDSETAEEECCWCGKTDGELLPVVRDANGVTLWEHTECRDAQRKINETAEINRQQRIAAREEYDRNEGW